MKKRFIILDGAMGTIMQKKGLAKDGHPDLFAIKEPEAIMEIHT